MIIQSRKLLIFAGCWVCTLVPIVVAMGCKGKSADPPQAVLNPQESVTYNEIAPIVWEKCSCCHREGESAPFSLISRKDFVKRERQIREVIEAGFMPPWLPNTPNVEYENDTRLTADQKRLLFTWFDQGAVEGDPKQRPDPPNWTKGWQLGKPDIVVSMPDPFELPADGPDVYRNFVVPIPTDQIRYVRAMEFRPGNQRVVHHAFMMIDPARQLRPLCNLDQQPGFGGMDTREAVSPGGHFIGWQPGRRPFAPPEDMAWQLLPGTDLVLQVHMQCTGKPEQFSGSVGFYFTDKIPSKKPVKLSLRSIDIDIPAGQPNYEIRDEFQLPVAIDLIAVAPHAHYLGKEMYVTAKLPGGETKQLLTIPSWDLNWQSDYRYQEYIHLPAGTVLQQRFVYDNSAQNIRNPHRPPRRVKFGPQANDEMGSVWFQALVSNPTERPMLMNAVLRKGIQESIQYNRRVLQAEPNDVAANIKLGKIALTMKRNEVAMNYFRRAADTDPESADAHYFWGQSLLRSGKIEEGSEKLRTCLLKDPQHYRAHYDLGYAAYLAKDFAAAERNLRNAIDIHFYDTRSLKLLGTCLLQQGKNDEALRFLKASLRVNPDDEKVRVTVDRINAGFNF